MHMLSRKDLNSVELDTILSTRQQVSRPMEKCKQMEKQRDR